MTQIAATPVLSVASMAAAMKYMLSFQKDRTGDIAQLQIDAQAVLSMLFAMLPMALFTAGLMVAAATRARGSREAVSYLAPLLFGGMMLSMLNILPGSTSAGGSGSSQCRTSPACSNASSAAIGLGPLCRSPPP